MAKKEKKSIRKNGGENHTSTSASNDQKKRLQAEARSLDRDAEAVEADEEEGKEEFGRENP